MNVEIPVYLITGFLESGKTRFLQGLLEDSEFNAGERTLILLCEEGIEELEPEEFSFDNVVIQVIDDKDQLNPDRLEQLLAYSGAERVIVEYNGMWMLQELFLNIPENWVIYQEVMFADATTFLTYNTNMRQLVYDKMKSAELIVFNRCVRGELDKEQFHKIVRGANRKNQIVYEYGDNDVEPDTIKDPLPYDLNAPVVVIRDADFAEWYRDINEVQKNYHDKTLRIKGRILTDGNLPEGYFVFGRHLMTCCVEDIQFAGLSAKWIARKPDRIKNGDWAVITAKVKVEKDPIYADVGPVLYCTELELCQPANPEVAMF